MTVRNEPMIDVVARAIKVRNWLDFQRLSAQEGIALMEPDAYLGKSWLYCAAEDGFVEVVRFFIECGMDPDIDLCQKEGRTALCAACNGGYIDIVRYLLDHGAVMDVSESVRNPLFATISGWNVDPRTSTGDPTVTQLEIARLLLDHGINTRTIYGKNKGWDDLDAIGFAWMWGRQDIARLIAVRQVGDDPEAIEALMRKGDLAAERNTEPVPKGETVRPS